MTNDTRESRDGEGAAEREPSDETLSMSYALRMTDDGEYRDIVSPSLIWFDTEFIEDGRTIDLLSIGLVRADGATYYAECAEADQDRASEWVRANVLPHMVGPIKPRAQIAAEIVAFAGSRPQFWAYYADYDWVALCQLYGTMMDLPKTWPMFCRDLKQLAGDRPLPPQTSTEHHALADAEWTRDAHMSISDPSTADRADRADRAARTEATPDKSITYLRAIYDWIDSTCPTGSADEAFRLVDAATRDQIGLPDARSGDDGKQRAVLGEPTAGATETLSARTEATKAEPVGMTRAGGYIEWEDRMLDDMGRVLLPIGSSIYAAPPSADSVRAAAVEDADREYLRGHAEGLEAGATWLQAKGYVALVQEMRESLAAQQPASTESAEPVAWAYRWRFRESDLWGKWQLIDHDPRPNFEPGSDGRTTECRPLGFIDQSSPSGTFACPICGKDYPHQHPAAPREEPADDAVRLDWLQRQDAVHVEVAHSGSFSGGNLRHEATVFIRSAEHRAPTVRDAIDAAMGLADRQRTTPETPTNAGAVDELRLRAERSYAAGYMSGNLVSRWTDLTDIEREEWIERQRHGDATLSARAESQAAGAEK